MNLSKIFGWDNTHRGSRRGKSSKINSNSQVDRTTGRRDASERGNNVDDNRYVNGVKDTLPDHLPVCFDAQCQHDLLVQRGIHQSKEIELTLQPKKGLDATPTIIDPDFFQDTPGAGTTIVLDGLSAAPAPRLHFGPDQAREMLEILSHDTFGRDRTPVCAPILEMITSEDAYLGAEANGCGSASADEQSESNAFARCRGFHESSPFQGAGRSPDLSGIPVNDYESETFRLEHMSKISVAKVLRMIDKDASLLPAKDIFQVGDKSMGDYEDRRASTTGSKSPSINGSPHTKPLKNSQSSKIETPDTRSLQMEDEDVFLHLAWANMPAQARSSRSQPGHKNINKPCPLPLPHPKIAAAQARNSAFKSSPEARQLCEDLSTVGASGSAAENTPDDLGQARQRIAKMSALAEFRAFMKDLLFVELYVDEMKERCAVGIWWEGWLVLEKLRDQGVVGSDF